MGRQGDRQGELMVMWSEMPRSPGHVFDDRLQEVLLGAGFDGFVEEACRAFYAKTMGAPRCRPVGISACTWSGTSRGSTASAGSSGAARTHSRYASSSAWSNDTGSGRFAAVEDASRLPHEVHETVFCLVLALIAERGLVRGERIGVDASTMEANAALRAIVRRIRRGLPRDAGAMAQESGIATPTAEDPIRLDRQRRGNTKSLRG